MIQYLKSLLTALNDYFRVVDKSELIGRFLFHSNEAAYNGGRVKYNAFLPAPNGETSVYRISDLSCDEIWHIGRNYVARARQKALRGRADVIASHILEKGLKIRPETKIHSLHANIIRWPTAKHEKKLIAEKLADKAKLYLPPFEQH